MMIRRNQYPNFTFGIVSVLILLLLMSPVSLFSQDSSPPSPDFNDDGVVDLLDYDLFRSQWDTRAGGPNWDAKFDLNGDGVIDLLDYSIFVSNWGKTVNSDDSPSQQQDAPQVTISAGTTPVTEGTSATFTITANPAPTSPLAVNVDVSEDGAVISGTPSSTVIINANNTTATLTVNTDNDEADESNSVITAEVESGTGYTVGSSSSASVTVNDNDDPAPPSTPPSQQPPVTPPVIVKDNDAPEITISAGTSPVAEGTSAAFTITASSAPTSPLIVNVDVSEDGAVISGTAPSTVTINANATTATLTVNTVNDQADESNSVVTAEVESGTGYTVGSTSSASVTVNDNDPPEVTISAGTSPVAEGTSATFTITASSAPTSPLIVNVDVSEDGAVISGTPSSTVIINANNTTATLTVNTVNDQADESNSVITAEVESGIGYTVSSSSSASVTVNDNDDPASPPRSPQQNAPEVTISAGTTPVTEGTSATFTITASSAPTTAITVSVSVTEDGAVISGTAPSTVTINANATTATLTVNTVNDQSDESNSVVTAEVQSGTGYTVGSSSSASVTVEDNENPNLEVWNQTVDNASPVQGDSFTLSVSVVNTGNGKSAATTLRYYRSTDATITTGDTAEGTDEVDALWSQGSADESVELTAPSTAGTYYYGACVDAVADESDTTDNCSASVEVDVQAPAKRVVISPRSLKFTALGSTATVTVKVLDENDDEDEDASWIWISAFSGSSTGISIEKVDGGIEITSTRTGSGRVDIFSDGAKTATLSVSVSQTPASLELSPSSKSLTVGGTVTLSATIQDANDNDIQLSEGGGSGLVVYWETSDATVATVAGVDADEDGNTGSTATVTAVAAGTATITCRWGGSSGIRGTATITVTE